MASIVAIVAARSITIRERPGGVEVLPSSQLARWLQRRPIALTETEIEELQRVTCDPATWGRPMLAEPDLGGFAVLRESVQGARRRRLVWASLVLLSPFAIIAAGLVALLH